MTTPNQAQGSFLPAFERIFKPLANSLGMKSKEIRDLLSKTGKELEEALKTHFENLAQEIEAEGNPVKLKSHLRKVEKLLDLIVSKSQDNNLKRSLDRVKKIQDENRKNAHVLQLLRSKELQQIIARNLETLARNPDLGKIFHDTFNNRFKNTTSAFARASDQLAYDPITQIMSIWYDMIMIMFETMAKIILGDKFVDTRATQEADPSRDRIVPMPIPTPAPK